MSDNSLDPSAIADRIRAYVDEQFDTGKDRVFLSTLGSNLGSLKDQIEDQHDMKFSEFIETRLGYPMGRTGEHQNILYIVPMGTKPDGLEQLPPKFARGFWAAFAKPLVEGERRFLNLKTLRFGETEAEIGGPSPSILEIEPKFVASEENSRNVADMVRRIDLWLQEHSLEREPFLHKKSKRVSQSTSVLDQILDSLNSDQLRRVSLPLDVIKSLS